MFSNANIFYNNFKNNLLWGICLKALGKSKYITSIALAMPSDNDQSFRLCRRQIALALDDWGNIRKFPDYQKLTNI